jgi:hypothetical protein
VESSPDQASCPADSAKGEAQGGNGQNKYGDEEAADFLTAKYSKYTNGFPEINFAFLAYFAVLISDSCRAEI